MNFNPYSNKEQNDFDEQKNSVVLLCCKYLMYFLAHFIHDTNWRIFMQVNITIPIHIKNSVHFVIQLNY